MTPIEQAPNVGAVLARDLRTAGIDSVEELRRLGAREAWGRIRVINPDRDCAHSLLALEGAIRGLRWMSIPPDDRAPFVEYAARQRRQGPVQ